MSPSWFTPSLEDVRRALVNGNDVHLGNRRNSRIERAIAGQTDEIRTWSEFWTHHYSELVKAANEIDFEEDFRQIAMGC